MRDVVKPLERTKRPFKTTLETDMAVTILTVNQMTDDIGDYLSI